MSTAAPGALLASLGLAPKDLTKLKALALQGLRALPGPGAGRRRSPRAGSSAELMDYRDYAPGDDLRRVDWNAYARLDKLFLRVYRAEENRLVRLLVDNSASMGYAGKLRLATGVAAGLAFMGLCSHDRVQVAAVGADRTHPLRPLTGEGAFPEIAGFLGNMQPQGTQELRRSAGQVLFGATTPGHVLLITDGLFPGGVIPVLKLLRAGGNEVSLIQVLDPAEVEPLAEGDWRLVDAERPGHQLEVTLTPRTAAQQAERVTGYLEEVEGFCRKQGITYLRLTSDLEPMTALLTQARQAGLVG